jgi:hypothetical protein
MALTTNLAKALAWLVSFSASRRGAARKGNPGTREQGGFSLHPNRVIAALRAA